MSNVRIKVGGMKYGYGRTSMDDQTTAFALSELKTSAVLHIFEDSRSTRARFSDQIPCWVQGDAQKFFH